MSAVYRKDCPPGLAGRWLIDHLRYEEFVRQNSALAAVTERSAVAKGHGNRSGKSATAKRRSRSI